MGAGGLGGYYGVRLAQTGHEVSFVARGAHLAAMRERGLRVVSRAGDAVLAPIRATGDPSTVGEVDCVVIAVKLWDLESAAQAALPMIGPATTVISFQNGVEKDAIVADIVGRAHLIGGVSYISVKIAEPGVIEHTGLQSWIVLGELDGTPSTRAAALAQTFSAAGVEASESDDITRTTWEKFVYLAALSGVTALLRATIGPIRANPEARSLLADAMHEGAAVGRARGVALAPDFVASQMRFTDTLPAEMRASMAVDLERGRRLELPWLSGAVVRFGRECDIATPVSDAIARALAIYANGARPAA
jgi:2-dehydropantoate 2-reductase